MCGNNTHRDLTLISSCNTNWVKKTFWTIYQMFSAFLITRSSQIEHWRPFIHAQQRDAGLIIFIYFCFLQKRKTFVWTLYPRALQPETAVSLLHYWWFLHLPKGESLSNLLNFWTPFIINLIMSKKVCCQTKNQSSVFFISPQKSQRFITEQFSPWHQVGSHGVTLRGKGSLRGQSQAVPCCYGARVAL